jgi:hypothetical protein
MYGIVPGRDFGARTREAFARIKAGDHSASDRLNDFLGRASTAVRGVYHGPLTYASLIWEDVDWDRFDLIGVDHYRDARNQGPVRRRRRLPRPLRIRNRSRFRARCSQPSRPSRRRCRAGQP